MTGPPHAASGRTLLVALAHPDDEVGTVAAIASQIARGDRVVLVWLTRGEATDAYGRIDPGEVAARRDAMAARVGRLLGVETRFLDFTDTGVIATRDASLSMARLIAEIKPDGVLTWGDAWVRGMRHPDHQATGRIVRDAITLARIRSCVEPLEPHREPAPIWTYRGLHSPLPAAAIDAEPYLDLIFGVADIYHQELQFPDRGWLEERLRRIGERWGCRWAEEFDAWETEGGLVQSLLPADPAGLGPHPERAATESPNSD
ncbi:MAG: PIG-L family deacetylase [marine benthic group bacterium]|nr:PIG-L family deacetylase [Gemmatimonadota bacterium]